MLKLMSAFVALAAVVFSIATVGAVHLRVKNLNVAQLDQPAVAAVAPMSPVATGAAMAPAPAPAPGAAPAMARCPPCNCKGIKARIPTAIFAKHMCPPCPCVGDMYYPEHAMTNERMRINRNL